MADISVIIPTYNYARYLPATLDSVFRQTFTDLEVIVVDDGSTDNTKDILQPYIHDERIRYIYQENRGLSAARNTGIRSSQSPFITFLDSDDLFTPRKLEVLRQEFERHPEAGLVYGNHVLWTGQHLYRQPRFPHGQAPSGWILPQLFTHPVMSVPAVLVRRECFDRAGFFDESLTAVEDWDMWMRIAVLYPMYYVNDVVTYVRVHANSMSTNLVNMSRNKLHVQKSVYRHYHQKLLEHFSQSQLDALFGQTYLEYAKHHLLQGKQSIARHYAKIAAGLDRRNLLRLAWLLPATYIPWLVRLVFGWKLRWLQSRDIDPRIVTQP